jgi:chaperonin GroEL
VDHDTTTLIEGGGASEDIRARIASLEREVTDAGSEYERDRLRQRLARLTGGVAVIRVGGTTETELKERRGRLEDALAATRAALEEGVVAGGGVALLRARAALEALDLAGDENIGVQIVRDALSEPMRQIAFNAGVEGDVVVQRVSEQSGHYGYNAISGDYEDLMQAGVIDPAKVTRAALQNAASIGALVLTTDAVVVESDDEAAPPEMEQ